MAQPVPRFSSRHHTVIHNSTRFGLEIPPVFKYWSNAHFAREDARELTDLFEKETIKAYEHRVKTTQNSEEAPLSVLHDWSENAYKTGLRRAWFKMRANRVAPVRSYRSLLREMTTLNRIYSSIEFPLKAQARLHEASSFLAASEGDRWGRRTILEDYSYVPLHISRFAPHEYYELHTGLVCGGKDIGPIWHALGRSFKEAITGYSVKRVNAMLRLVHPELRESSASKKNALTLNAALGLAYAQRQYPGLFHTVHDCIENNVFLRAHEYVNLHDLVSRLPKKEQAPSRQKALAHLKSGGAFAVLPQVLGIAEPLPPQQVRPFVPVSRPLQVVLQRPEPVVVHSDEPVLERSRKRAAAHEETPRTTQLFPVASERELEVAPYSSQVLSLADLRGLSTSMEQWQRKLERLGFQLVRAKKHLVFRGDFDGITRTVVVPRHSHLNSHTLLQALRDGGITQEELARVK